MTRWWVGLFVVGLISAPGLGDDSPVGLPDLEAYRAALGSKGSETPPTVRFRDLWDRPDEFRGRAVAIEGRVARLFRQPKVGDFPPLVEAWLVSGSGDPTCVVFPPVEGRGTPEVGAQVRFSGTFLKRIRYDGGDVPRLAPLVVGPEAPVRLDPSSDPGGMDWSQADWMMATGAVLVVGLVLARRHLSGPSVSPRRVEPPPSFVDGESDPDPEHDEEASRGSGR